LQKRTSASHWKFPMGAVVAKDSRLQLCWKISNGRWPGPRVYVANMSEISNGSCRRQRLNVANAWQFPMGAAVVKDSTLQMHGNFQWELSSPSSRCRKHIGYFRWELPLPKTQDCKCVGMPLLKHGYCKRQKVRVTGDSRKTRMQRLGASNLLHQCNVLRAWVARCELEAMTDAASVSIETVDGQNYAPLSGMLF